MAFYFVKNESTHSAKGEREKMYGGPYIRVELTYSEIKRLLEGIEFQRMEDRELWEKLSIAASRFEVRKAE